ncbi:MAG: hypothetical protein ACI32N_03025 [Bulleidia sp.]
MNSYDRLSEWIVENGRDRFELTFDQMEQILGFPVNHAFLTYKKQLVQYGFEVVRISMKNRTVLFRKV